MLVHDWSWRYGRCGRRSWAGLRSRPSLRRPLLCSNRRGAAKWRYNHFDVASAAATNSPVCGIGLTAFFAVLSEMNFGDRFEDHFLTSYQAAANIILQLVFLLVAPEIGFLFLTVVFVIFGFAALRQTSREAAILWAFTGFGVTTIFF